MQLPDIKKQQGVGDKIKEGMEKEKTGEGKTENLGSRQKERMVFKMGYGRSRCTFAGDIQGTEQLHEALENELNKV
jgi:hypothetical protein